MVDSSQPDTDSAPACTAPKPSLFDRLSGYGLVGLLLALAATGGYSHGSASVTARLRDCEAPKTVANVPGLIINPVVSAYGYTFVASQVIQRQQSAPAPARKPR